MVAEGVRRRREGVEDGIRREASVVMERIGCNGGLDEEEKKVLKKTLKNVTDFKVRQTRQVCPNCSRLSATDFVVFV